MSQLYVFTPKYGTGVTVAPTTSNATIQSQSFVGKKQYVVSNLGAEICYIRPFINGDVNGGVATSSDYPLLPNTQQTLTKDQAADSFAYISDSGTGSLHIIVGEGY